MNKTNRFYLGVIITMSIILGIGITPSSAQMDTIQNNSIIDVQNEEVNIGLQAKQRVVNHGEPIILDLSATSYVSNSEPITIQLIVESSSDVSVTSSTAEQGSGNQFSTVTTIDPGSSESLRVVITPSEPGEYNVTSEIIYYVGNNRKASSGERAVISVTQNPPPHDLSYWTPTILGLVLGSTLAVWLLRPPKSEKIQNWGSDVPVFTTLIIVFIGSISVFFAGAWFASYARLQNVTAGEVGTTLSIITAVVGFILTLIAGMGQFTNKVRILYAGLSITTVIAVPIQMILTLLRNLLL